MERVKVFNLAVLAVGFGLSLLGIILVANSGGNGLDTSPSTDQPKDWIAQGADLIAEKNCNFCHRTELPKDHVPRDNCQLCHQKEMRVENLAPPMNRIAERRPQSWTKRFLRYPHTVRQNSNDRMPDLSLSDHQIKALTSWIYAQPAAAEIALDDGPSREDKPDAEKMQAGARLFEERQCNTCHELGDHEIEIEFTPNGVPIKPPAVFAPSLDYTFTRVRPGWLVAAIKDPHKWMPWSGMYSGVTDEEAETLAYWIMNQPVPKTDVNSDRVVGILRANCNGCHYGPEEKAPPSTNPLGGAGWLDFWSAKPRKLDLMTLKGLLSGSVDDLGHVRPAVVPYAENSPLLMHLKGRKQPHMPMGMNPLNDEDLKAIEEWIMAGAPVPKGSGIKVHPPIEMGD
ncbi:MAG: c-type cytochrome [Planctomycetota bacterium]|jgi:mono/diheme cytochrome c family protein